MSTALGRNAHKVTLFGMAGKFPPRKASQVLWRDFSLGGQIRMVLLPFLSAKILKPLYGPIAALLVRANCELVISRSLTAAFFSALRGFPVVLEIHQPVSSDCGSSRWFMRGLLASRWLRMVVVITQALENEMLKQWPGLQGTTLTLPDGASPRPKTLEPSIASEFSPFKVGYVGHLYAGKGADFILLLARNMPNYFFHIVGGREQDIARLRAKLDLPSNLTIHGWIPPALVPAKLNEFDLLLLPNMDRVFLGSSRTDIGRWTSPLKLFEYMASGKAIVSSNLPVLREVLNHGENAWLCAPGEVDEWVTAISYLAGEKELRKFLGENAERDFLRKFSWERRAERLLIALDGGRVEQN